MSLKYFASSCTTTVERTDNTIELNMIEYLCGGRTTAHAFELFDERMVGSWNYLASFEDGI